MRLSALKNTFGMLLAALAAFVMLCPHRAASATTNVFVRSNFFSPRNVTIWVGDTVLWTWNTIGSHNTTHIGSPRLWASGIRANGDTFSYVFDAAGEYPYECTRHNFPQDMYGNVTVMQVTNPPALISGPHHAAGQFRFSYSASVGARYAVESSTNLAHWRGEATNTATAPTVNYTNTVLHDAVFYRVLRLTDP